MALTCCLYTFPISDLDPNTMHRLGFTATETLLWDYSNSEEFYVYVIPPAIDKPTLFLVPNTYAYQWYGLNGNNGLQIVYYPFLNMNFTNLQNPCHCPPTVTKVDPNIGGQDIEVVVTGTRFSGVTAVNFDADPAVSYTLVNDTTITAIVPDHGPGITNVIVTTNGGTSPITPGDQYTYSLPIITSMEEASGHVNDVFSIFGLYFTDVIQVLFGSTPAIFAVINDTTINVTVPAGTGTVDVRVVTSVGTSAITGADQFTYVALVDDGMITEDNSPSPPGDILMHTEDDIQMVKE